jgi:glycosyltransferase involved in cell wall biosynthesis
MRIALVSTLATKVAARGAGSIEGMVWLLSRELTALGHEVTVFAVAGSQVHGRLVATLPGTYGENGAPENWQLCEFMNLCAAVERSREFDVIHSHAYLWGMTLERLSAAAMVHTLHMNPVEEYTQLWGLHPDACVTAISQAQWSGVSTLKPMAVIHHGIDETQFTFQAEAEDYVCFLGRFVAGKGPLDAIAAAKAMGVTIVLAGPKNDYFKLKVAPLVDGERVRYVGPVHGVTRDKLLGGARALVYANREAEPFGLVMAEAMMCGTPVAAMRCGAVGEIVEEGVTGYWTETLEELPKQIARCFELDRGAVQRRARERFSASRMAREYVAAYEQAIERRRLRDGASKAMEGVRA